MQNDVRPINAYTFADHLRDWQQDIENDYYIEPYKRDIISNTLQTAIEDLDDQLTIDAVPVVHGRWVKVNGMMPPEYHGRKCCSVCDAFALSDFYGRERLSDFCPNCGAKMDGDVDDENSR